MQKCIKTPMFDFLGDLQATMLSTASIFALSSVNFDTVLHLNGAILVFFFPLSSFT